MPHRQLKIDSVCGVDILKVWHVDPSGSKWSKLLSLQNEDVLALFHYSQCTGGAKAAGGVLMQIALQKWTRVTDCPRSVSQTPFKKQHELLIL